MIYTILLNDIIVQARLVVAADKLEKETKPE